MSRLLSPSAPPRLALARRRAALRASSGGGIMFVVAMTLAVLAGLGAWALQSAALEVRMAGYERQNTQTHYISEYGVLAAMQNLDPTHAQAIIPGAVGGVNGTRPTCVSAPTQYDTSSTCLARACWVWLNAQSAISLANSSYTYPATGTPYAIDPSSTTAAGSLGYTAMQGDFTVEMTEPAQASSASQPGTSGQAFYWVTLSSYGQTNLALDAGSTASFNSQGDETLRSRVLVGPVPPVNVTTCP
jgi:hypothetical protein